MHITHARDKDFGTRNYIEVVVLADKSDPDCAITFVWESVNNFTGLSADARLYVDVLKANGFFVQRQFFSHSPLSVGFESSKELDEEPRCFHSNIVFIIEGKFAVQNPSFLDSVISREYLRLGRLDFSRYCHALVGQIQKSVGYEPSNAWAYDCPWYPTHEDCVTFLGINQEFVPDRYSLHTADRLIVKTKAARQLLEAANSSYFTRVPPLVYTKHSSPFPFEENVSDLVQAKNYSLFIHFNRAQSWRKNSRIVYETWARHPEWPQLVLVHPRREWMAPVMPHNIDWHESLPYDRLKLLSKTAGVFVCPSSAEGYGHYINEGRAAGALVMVTDMPPMNELISEVDGMLIPVARTYKLGELGVPHAAPTHGELEVAVERVLALPAEEKQRRGLRAQQRYFADHAYMAQKLMETVRGHCSRHGRKQL